MLAYHSCSFPCSFRPKFTRLDPGVLVVNPSHQTSRQPGCIPSALGTSRPCPISCRLTAGAGRRIICLLQDLPSASPAHKDNGNLNRCANIPAPPSSLRRSYRCCCLCVESRDMKSTQVYRVQRSVYKRRSLLQDIQISTISLFAHDKKREINQN